ncbi:hypothetical protein ACEWY4_007306 [Coilia grayii]|uniref:DDE Tnp4 domain-containing protein n=1 Tax=Coilia grayii TaxID=363190 RepID=A0ABD1KFW6_9TELE
MLMLSAYWHLAASAETVSYAWLNRAVPLLRLFFEGEDTCPDFRLSRVSVIGLLQLLDQERDQGWGPAIEVLVFLVWLASASYRVVSRAFNMPRTMVHNVVHHVCGDLLQMMPYIIRVPSTAEELRKVGDGFARLAGHGAFHKAMGAIDGCHIRIKAPGEPHAQCYRNRKLFPLIQLQAVCNHAGVFIYVFGFWLPRFRAQCQGPQEQPPLPLCHIPGPWAIPVG